MIDIRAIRSEADYDAALAEIERYFANPPDPGTVEAERFDVLADLIEVYEARHWAIEDPDPVEAIQYRMDLSGYSQSDLARLLGSRSRASEILHRKRQLTLEMAHKLNTEWKIPAEVLLKPSRSEGGGHGAVRPEPYRKRSTNPAMRRRKSAGA